MRESKTNLIERNNGEFIEAGSGKIGNQDKNEKSGSGQEKSGNQIEYELKILNHFKQIKIDFESTKGELEYYFKRSKELMARLEELQTSLEIIKTKSGQLL